MPKIIAFTVLTLAMAGCRLASEPEQPYEVVTERGQSVVVEVDQTTTSYDGILDEVQGAYVDGGGEGAYYIRIVCSTGQTSAAAELLAERVIAIGRIGEAATGGRVPAGESVTEIDADQECPVDEGPRSAADEELASEVVAAFLAAGLPATDPRFNPANCAVFGCSAWLTTDEATVQVFPDRASAQIALDDPVGSTVLVGDRIVLSRLPEDLADEYVAAARSVVE